MNRIEKIEEDIREWGVAGDDGYDERILFDIMVSYPGTQEVEKRRINLHRCRKTCNGEGWDERYEINNISVAKKEYMKIRTLLYSLHSVEKGIRSPQEVIADIMEL